MKEFKKAFTFKCIQSIKENNKFLLFLIPFMEREALLYFIKYAIKFDNFFYFKLLLKRKIKLSKCSIEYRNFIDYAAFYNNEKIFNFLMDNSKKYNLSHFSISYHYHSAFKYAVKNKNTIFIKKLLDSEFFKPLSNNTDLKYPDYLLCVLLEKKHVSIQEIQEFLNHKKIEERIISSDLLFKLLRLNDINLFKKYVYSYINYLKKENSDIKQLFLAFSSYLIPLNLFENLYNYINFNTEDKKFLINFLIKNHPTERIHYIQFLFDNENLLKEHLKVNNKKLYNKLNMKDSISIF